MKTPKNNFHILFDNNFVLTYIPNQSKEFKGNISFIGNKVCAYSDKCDAFTRCFTVLLWIDRKS